MLTVSYSAISAYRECPMRYYLAHVIGLRRKDRPIPLETGTILHEYLAAYYRHLKAEPQVPTAVAHAYARSAVGAAWGTKLDSLASDLYQAGEAQRAEETAGLLSVVQRIADRYFAARGAVDAEEWEVLDVEFSLRVSLAHGIHSIGYVDLLARSRVTGRLAVWDHKTGRTLPDADRRWVDLQTPLYARKLAAVRGLTADSVVWNYLRTKEPAVPDVLKSGGLTRRADLDTTAEVYRQALTDNRLDEGDYVDVLDRLRGRELDVFFPRHEVPLVLGDVVLSDYRETAKRIKADRRSWERGVLPTHNVGLHCSWCEYRPVTMAALTGGNREEVIAGWYTTRKRGDNDNQSESAAPQT